MANTLCQLFGELYRKAGIDGASSHRGRRSFITKLAHSGISAKVIMEFAGHKHHVAVAAVMVLPTHSLALVCYRCAKHASG